MTDILENRVLTSEESLFVRWLLEQGDERARSFLPQVEQARVISRCGCGCASIDFSINGVTPSPQTGTEMLGDYYWHSATGDFFGVFVFAYGGLLAGIDLYSIDGQSTPVELPDVSILKLMA